MIKISIVSTVYNKEKFLKKHVSSLINQSIKEVEFIFVNDGSTDNSLDILNNLTKNDSRVKIINQSNQGPNIARKEGFKVAHGEYVYFIDSDDSISGNNVLQNLCNIIDKNKPDCICAQIINQYDNKDVVDLCIYGTNLVEKKYPISYMYDKLFRPSLCYKIFKRELISDDDFVNERNFEDCYFSYSVLNKCKSIYTYPKAIYKVNRKNENNNSLSSNLDTSKTNNKYNLLKKIQFNFRNFDISIKKMYTKTFLDDLNLSCLLNYREAKELIRILQHEKSNVSFDNELITSNHYKRIKIFRCFYLNIITNRIISYYKSGVLGLKIIVKKIIGVKK